MSLSAPTWKNIPASISSTCRSWMSALPRTWKIMSRAAAASPSSWDRASGPTSTTRSCTATAKACSQSSWPIGQDDWEHAFAVAVQLLVVEVGPDARSHEEGDAAAALDIIFQVLGSALIQLRHVEEIDAGIFFQVGALKLIDAAALYLETPRCREERL